MFGYRSTYIVIRRGDLSHAFSTPRSPELSITSRDQKELFEFLARGTKRVRQEPGNQLLNADTLQGNKGAHECRYFNEP